MFATLEVSLRDGDTQTDAVAELLLSLHGKGSAEQRAILRLISQSTTPCAELTRIFLEYMKGMSGDKEGILAMLEYLPQIAGSSALEFHAILETFKAMVASDRALLVPMLGCLASLSLPDEYKNEVFTLTANSLPMVEEADVPTVAQTLLRSLSRGTARSVITAIRREFRKVERGTAALLLAVVYNSFHISPLAQTAYLADVGAQPRLLTIVDIALLLLLQGHPKFLHHRPHQHQQQHPSRALSVLLRAADQGVVTLADILEGFDRLKEASHIGLPRGYAGATVGTSGHDEGRASAGLASRATQAASHFLYAVLRTSHSGLLHGWGVPLCCAVFAGFAPARAGVVGTLLGWVAGGRGEDECVALRAATALAALCATHPAEMSAYAERIEDVLLHMEDVDTPHAQAMTVQRLCTALAALSRQRAAVRHSQLVLAQKLLTVSPSAGHSPAARHQLALCMLAHLLRSRGLEDDDEAGSLHWLPKWAAASAGSELSPGVASSLLQLVSLNTTALPPPFVSHVYHALLLPALRDRAGLWPPKCTATRNNPQHILVTAGLLRTGHSAPLSSLYFPCSGPLRAESSHSVVWWSALWACQKAHSLHELAAAGYELPQDCWCLLANDPHAGTAEEVCHAAASGLVISGTLLTQCTPEDCHLALVCCTMHQLLARCIARGIGAAPYSELLSRYAVAVPPLAAALSQLDLQAAPALAFPGLLSGHAMLWGAVIALVHPAGEPAAQPFMPPAALATLDRPSAAQLLAYLVDSKLLQWLMEATDLLSAALVRIRRSTKAAPCTSATPPLLLSAQCTALFGTSSHATHELGRLLQHQYAILWGVLMLARRNEDHTDRFTQVVLALGGGPSFGEAAERVYERLSQQQQRHHDGGLAYGALQVLRALCEGLAKQHALCTLHWRFLTTMHPDSSLALRRPAAPLGLARAWLWACEDDSRPLLAPSQHIATAAELEVYNAVGQLVAMHTPQHLNILRNLATATMQFLSSDDGQEEHPVVKSLSVHTAPVFVAWLLYAFARLLLHPQGELDSKALELPVCLLGDLLACAWASSMGEHVNKYLLHVLCIVYTRAPHLMTEFLATNTNKLAQDQLFSAVFRLLEIGRQFIAKTTNSLAHPPQKRKRGSADSSGAALKLPQLTYCWEECHRELTKIRTAYHLSLVTQFPDYTDLPIQWVDSDVSALPLEVQWAPSVALPAPVRALQEVSDTAGNPVMNSADYDYLESFIKEPYSNRDYFAGFSLHQKSSKGTTTNEPEASTPLVFDAKEAGATRRTIGATPARRRKRQRVSDSHNDNESDQ